MPISLDDILAANPEARVHGAAGSVTFTDFAFDSRRLEAGQLFLAVRTAKADGHDYIHSACQKGAAGVVCQRPIDLSPYPATCIVVPDTEVAVRNWARYVLRRLGTPLVGVTGSAGKTSTKEALAHVLGARFEVFRNPGNYNGRFGLPVALGRLGPEHEVAVVEMAIDSFGEMALMTDMAPPSVAVVCNVGPAHLETFGTLEAVAREKGALVEALAADGLAVLNGDDPLVAGMAARTDARVEWLHVNGLRDGSGPLQPPAGGRTVTTDGLQRQATGNDGSTALCAHEVSVSASGTRFAVELESGRVELTIPWIGRHFVFAALACVSVGRRFGLSIDDIADRLTSLPPVRGRTNPLPGASGSLILDDSYNSSPSAALAALDTLAEIAGGSKLAVLGDMAELGDYWLEGHCLVGQRVAGVADYLVTKGQLARQIALAARQAGMAPEKIVVTYTADDAARAVRERLLPGSLVLVKGSAVTRMEQVSERLLADRSTAARVLVRQEPVWRQVVIHQRDRPTWVEIDLEAVAHNVARVRSIVGPDVRIMAVLKADAYGHGALHVAPTAINNGADWLGVACLPEAEALRAAGIDAPMLILGYTPAWQARAALRLDVSVTVFDWDTAQSFNQAAQDTRTPARVHVKVDTGMHRLGIAPQKAAAFVGRLRDLDALSVEGVFTHFAAADMQAEPEQQFTLMQLASFERLVAELDSLGLRPPLVHCANSAALLTLPGALFDMVRPGILLYGLQPGHFRPPDARAALTWKTQVGQVRELASGEAVGYGLAWRADGPARIATIPVGYADGFRRGPATWRHVLVRGQPAPVVGRVSMDQATLDVTAIPDVRQGDEVVLLGAQGRAEVSAEMVADWLGTINYEVVSQILPRVPRIGG